MSTSKGNLYVTSVAASVTKYKNVTRPLRAVAFAFARRSRVCSFRSHYLLPKAPFTTLRALTDSPVIAVLSLRLPCHLNECATRCDDCTMLYGGTRRPGGNQTLFAEVTCEQLSRRSYILESSNLVPMRQAPEVRPRSNCNAALLVDEAEIFLECAVVVPRQAPEQNTVSVLLWHIQVLWRYLRRPRPRPRPGSERLPRRVSTP